MERLVLKINQIKKNHYNLFNDLIFERLKASIQKYGQIKPVLVRELPGKIYEVIDGNLIVSAIESIGKSDYYCISLGIMTDEQFNELKIILNEVKFERDTIKVSELISPLAPNSFQIKILSGRIPFNETDIERYTRLNEVDWRKELKLAEEQEKVQKGLFD